MSAKVVWSRRSVVLGIVILFLVTRLYNLALIPLSGSEATPLTWALWAHQARDWSDWFAAVRAGAQPLHSWLLVPLTSLASNCADQPCHLDHALAARLLSVASGAVTLTLVSALTMRLFGRAAAFASALVYVCAPLTLLHDRLALPAALLAAVSLLALWCLLVWCAQPNWWRWPALGLALGMVLLTSVQAVALFFVVPGVVALRRPPALRHWWSLANAFLLAGLLYAVVFTAPAAGGNSGERIVLHNPLESTVVWLKPSGVGVAYRAVPRAAAAAIAPDRTTSARALAAVAWTYLTWPFVVLLVGVALSTGAAGLRRGLGANHPERSGAARRVAGASDSSVRRGVAVCLLWSVGSAAGVLSSGLAPTTADLVFVVAPTFPLVGWGLTRLTAAAQRLPELASPLTKWSQALAGWPARRVAAGIILAVCVTPAVVWDWSLLSDPTSVARHDDPGVSDRARYVEGRQSGYGLREIVERLRAAAEQRQVVVFTADAAGMPRDGVRVLLGDVPNLELDTLPPEAPVADQLAQRRRSYRAASTGATLFYLLDDDHGGTGDRELRRANPGARVVQRVVKPGNASHRFVLYALPWQPPGDDRWLDPAPRFGERIALAGYALPATTYRAGDTVQFTLFWEALATPTGSYTVFTHIVADDPAQKIGQLDQRPVAGTRPTLTWRRGDLITDPYAVPLDPNARPGSYRVIVGLYRFETLARLPITLGGEPVGGDFYALGKIVVTAP